MDLQGQAASESAGHRHLTGTGGQLQFVRGAYASEGGKAFMCLSSTYERRGERKSRIVSTLTPGNIVTTPRTDVMYVVTEYGMVKSQGKIARRARQGADLACSSRLPRAARARCARQWDGAERLLVVAGSRVKKIPSNERTVPAWRSIKVSDVIMARSAGER